MQTVHPDRVVKGAAPSPDARGTKGGESIDFVLMWVDGTDPRWLARKRECAAAEAGQSSDADANGECRYREMGLLRYWFRGVERFAPWVGRIFLVTDGQKPDWLDETHPKLCLTDHRDFMPSKYLPSFQSSSIEINLHRIRGLSETFVLFNDDMFLLRPCAPGCFFRGGLPVLPCDLGIPNWLGPSRASRIVVNNCGILRHCLDVNRLVRRNFPKFLDVRALGWGRAAKNLLSFAVNRTVIQGCFGHLALPHLKSTFEAVWGARPGIMDRTSSHRFRHDDDVNQWFLSSWNLVTGRFHPANEKRMGGCIGLREETLETACEGIVRHRWPQICLNDTGHLADPRKCFGRLAEAFDSILPEKSSFEK